MAQAKILYQDATDPDENNGGFCSGVIFKVLYSGPDAPLRNTNGSLSVTVTPTSTFTEIESAMAAAIRADAVSRGFTVPNAKID